MTEAMLVVVETTVDDAERARAAIAIWTATDVLHRSAVRGGRKSLGVTPATGGHRIPPEVPARVTFSQKSDTAIANKRVDPAGQSGAKS